MDNLRCDRCQPGRLCLVHETQERSAAFLRDRDHREALARGRIRYERNSRNVRGWA
jgi:hypothetical protein